MIRCAWLSLSMRDCSLGTYKMEHTRWPNFSSLYLDFPYGFKAEFTSLPIKSLEYHLTPTGGAVPRGHH